MDTARRDPPPAAAATPAAATARTGAGRGGTGAPVVICITDAPEERTRLAGLFDGVGVLVMASDADTARTLLARLRTGPCVPGDAAATTAGGVVRVDGLRLDRDHHEATWRDRPLHLTRHELEVLACLASSPGRVWTYRQLHEHAWDGPYFTGPAAVQSVIKRLRAKLRQSGVSLHIDAARGVGYRLAGARTC